MTKSKPLSEHGFTLTEMLVVLVLIALLVALVAPNFLGRLGGARSQTAQTQLDNLAGALDLYLIDTGGGGVRGTWPCGMRAGFVTCFDA